MDKKGVTEIRKCLAPKKCVINKVRGLYVDENGKPVTELKDSFLSLSEEMVDEYCDIFKKTIAGKPGKNLFELEFPIEEEKEDGKQALLYGLLKSELDDRDLRNKLYDVIMENYRDSGKYLIILSYGAYDIPAKTTDNESLEDASEYVFQFMLCSICPVVPGQEVLTIDETKSLLGKIQANLTIQPPVHGFMYPAFIEREPDIHNMVYMAKKEDDKRPDLAIALSGTELGMSETDQKNMFSDIIEQTFERDCSYENIMGITSSIRERLKENSDSDETLEFGKNEIKSIMKENAVPEECIDRFDKIYTDTVGNGNTLTAENLTSQSSVIIETADIRITVKADMAQMLSTKIIDGREYIMIPIQDSMELGGIHILPSTIKKE